MAGEAHVRAVRLLPQGAAAFRAAESGRWAAEQRSSGRGIIDLDTIEVPGIVCGGRAHGLLQGCSLFRTLDRLFDLYLSDPTAWDLSPNGEYVRREARAAGAQEVLLDEPIAALR